MKAAFDRRKFLQSAIKLPLICSASYAGLGFRLTHAVDIDRSVLNEHQITSLQRFSYLLFPYPEIGDEPYRLTVAAISLLAKNNSASQSIIERGIEQIDTEQAKPWIELDEMQQITVLEKIEEGEFFQWMYNITLNQIYTNKDVWDHIGYEGSSLELGGYLHRGFDDIKWL